jgi:23S rRNA (guanosine2251-2'-O)-methyltransferase
MILHLRNPHSVLAALETRPQDVIEIVIPQKLAKQVDGEPRVSSPKTSIENQDVWTQVAAQAQKLGVRVSSVAKSLARSGSRKSRGFSRRDAMESRGSAAEESQRTSVAEGLVRERTGVSLEVLFRDAETRKGGQGLWIALDTLQDPQNVGAIFRAAAYFSVEGIILTQDRSAPMTATVYDVASGGVEYIPFVHQPNLQRAFEVAKDSGLWILGTSEHAKDRIESIQKDRPWLLVLGNEEKGMRRLTQETCDVLCKISGTGKVTSLNVSVAAGIFISKLS